MPTYVLRDLDASPDQRRILLITEPDDLRGVAVVMGDHTVFLPGIPGFRPQTCEQLVQACRRYAGTHQRLKVDLNGKEIPWPRVADILLG